MSSEYNPSSGVTDRSREKIGESGLSGQFKEGGTNLGSESSQGQQKFSGSGLEQSGLGATGEVRITLHCTCFT